MALLGLLRALETTTPPWRPRASWDLECAPLRPRLHIVGCPSKTDVCEAAAAGVTALAQVHEFGGRQDLNWARREARDLLEATVFSGRDRADLFAALVSDAAVKEDKDQVEATPFCLLFGQGHQHFLDRFAQVPKTVAPPPRGRGRNAVVLDATECLEEALFTPWQRRDETFAFRWDPAEDVRYALMADDPSSQRTTTQHGANRLAAIGLPVLTVAPVARAGGRVRLMALGGSDRMPFSFAWPIWRGPASLSAIRAMLAHPDLRTPNGLAHLGVDRVVEATRLSVGKFMNFGPARPITVEN
ncbi:MAG TPA: hypothetical protein VMU93_03355 [Caulobacteraceae bacterium]|nr:hypothetical protein [Caulobacteraceae bacterium]